MAAVQGNLFGVRSAADMRGSGGEVRVAVVDGVITCRAPRRRPRWDGDQCGGFVARVPFVARVCGLPRHSDQARPGHLVAPCRRCGTLHEIEVMPREELACADAG